MWKETTGNFCKDCVGNGMDEEHSSSGFSNACKVQPLSCKFWCMLDCVVKNPCSTSSHFRAGEIERKLTSTSGKEFSVLVI